MNISNIALSVQIAGISILFLLFVFLSRHDRRLYIRYWTWSWFLYAASLSILLFSFLNGLSWPYAAFQILELSSAAMVTAAGMNYARGFFLRKKHLILLLPAVLWSVGCTMELGDFNGLYMLHAGFMGGAFAYNAYVFFSSRTYRQNVGTRLLAYTCSVMCLVDFHYVIVFGYAFRHNLGSMGYLQYCSFCDLLMQYVLAIGMVVMGMQETQHRLKDANSKLREAQGRLQTLAKTDPLTGVYNRHAFRDICDRELESDRPLTLPHALILLDIDNQKKINDLVGHSMGDEILRTVARSISSMIRGTDCLVRWGGDEFLLLMRETSLSQARERMDLLTSHLREQFVNSPAGKIYFGISFGCAELNSLENLSKAIEVADQEMFRQKQLSKKALVLV